MSKFVESGWYQFKNKIALNAFSNRFAVNSEFAEWIGLNPFMVRTLNDEGEVSVVENEEGEPYNIHITKGIEFDLLDIRHDLFWEKGEKYQIKSPKDLYDLVKSSAINKRFMIEVGFNPFMVKELDTGVYGNCSKTTVIEYLNQDMTRCRMMFALTQAERRFFNVYVKNDLVNYFARGPECNDMYIDSIKETLTLTPAKAKEILYPEPIMRVKGVVTITVSNEIQRLEAIKALQGFKYASV